MLGEGLEVSVSLQNRFLSGLCLSLINFCSLLHCQFETSYLISGLLGMSFFGLHWSFGLCRNPCLRLVIISLVWYHRLAFWSCFWLSSFILRLVICWNLCGCLSFSFAGFSLGIFVTRCSCLSDFQIGCWAASWEVGLLRWFDFADFIYLEKTVYLLVHSFHALLLVRENYLGVKFMHSLLIAIHFYHFGKMHSLSLS